MKKGNYHKKVTEEDKFDRRYRCDNGRLAQIRSEKKAQKKKFRYWLNTVNLEELDDYSFYDDFE